MAFLNFIVLAVFLPQLYAIPEKGLWQWNLQQNKIESIWRTLYKDTVIDVTVQCNSPGKDKIQILWLLKETSCFNEQANVDKDYLKSVFDDPTHDYLSCERGKYVYLQTVHVCDGNKTSTYFQGSITSCKNASTERKRREGTDGKATGGPSIKPNTSSESNSPEPQETKSSTVSKLTSTLAPPSSSSEQDNSPLVSIPMKAAKGSQKPGLWKTGVYLLILKIREERDLKLENVDIEVKFHHQDSYLGPIDYPLYVFYSVMCAVYAVFFVYWLACSCLYRKDMLRVQYWIALVILLGMMEKAFFLKEYTSTNKNGSPATSGVMMAEVVSALKRTLARILVVIVSLGFGIVKPRLGTSLYKVLGLGGSYFVLSSIEAYVRLNSNVKAGQKRDLIVYIPVTVIDAVFFYWIFVSISQTMRTLRLRRNVIKLKLYRHFCNCLIFCLLFALAFMIWSVVVFRFSACVKHWREFWLNDAFWHMLFAVILLAIIILWRPSQNNQRYAFSPLLDESDDEEEEFTKSGALESVKSRSKSPSRSRSASRSRTRSVDDDLKWVEENIPKSVADAVVALDSDEEVATTRRELSKMD